MSELAEAVRTGDPDRFWPTMAAPAAARQRLWPVYAVNLHLARAPWASDQPLLAEMRLQWWIDALRRAASGGATDDDPAELRALGPAVAAALAEVAEARRGDCSAEPFTDAQDLMQFLDATGGGVAWAAGLSLGATEAEAEALRAAGRSQALAAYLRAAPALAARGRDRLGALSAPDLADLARTSRQRAALPSRPLRPAIYPLVLARPVLRRAGTDPAAIRDGRLSLSEFHRRALLARLAITGWV